MRAVCDTLRNRGADLDSAASGFFIYHLRVRDR
jgi:hypothetical protein